MGHGGKRPGAGRKKGIGNSVSQEAREKILAMEPVEKVAGLIEKLDNPKDKIDAYLRLMVHAVPRLAASQVDLKAALMGDTTLVVNLGGKKKKHAK